MIRAKIAVLAMSLPVAALLGVTNGAFADDSAGAASSTKVQMETIRGVLPSSTTPECSTAGATYADQCPGSGSGGCSCLDVTSATASGPMFGNGMVTLFITEDTLLAFLNQGTFCEPLTSKGNETILGGFAIETGASNGETGFGDAQGTVNPTTHEIIIKLNGQITP